MIGAEREELALMGQTLGGLRWVQGPGGNVSVKSATRMWVKASGTRLSDVASDAGHAEVQMDIATKALTGDPAAEAELFARKPRPSLETYFHALPARVVAHTHPVGAHLYASSTDASPPDIGAIVREIPYVRPGRGVALAIADVLVPNAYEQLLVLRSHGIVAFAPTAERAISLTKRFDEAVRAQHDSLPDFEPLVASYLSFAPCEEHERIVVQKIPSRASNATASTPPRYLFPDAPVCASTYLIQEHASAEAWAVEVFALTKRAGILVTPDGSRTAFAKSAEQLSQTLEVLAAHDWIEDALVKRGTARYLPDDEPAKILDMPSEQYRIRLAAKS